MFIIIGVKVETVEGLVMPLRIMVKDLVSTNVILDSFTKLFIFEVMVQLMELLDEQVRVEMVKC